MRPIAAVILILCAGLPSAQSQVRPRNLPPNSSSRRKTTLSPTPHTLQAQTARLPESAGRNVIPATCPEDMAGAVCGYVKVPLDRLHPKGDQISIYFELYPHSGSGPAESAILVNFGGPGGATASSRDFILSLFGPNLDVHDLLLIDNRGTGLSAVIDCEALQHGTASFVKSEKDCAAQLGDAASRYGSGDIAQDVDAVRAALGYDRVDYYGASYGGADAEAYATRFGDHVRSLVLDAPYGTPALDPFKIAHYRIGSYIPILKLDCLRSPTCSPDQPNPKDAIAQLVLSIRAHPVQGNAFDANGNLVHVKIDETALLNFLVDVSNSTGNFTSAGELLAAAAALKQGDPAPLLRLGAEGSFTLVGDSGDPTFFSAGDFYANLCADAKESWDWSNSVRRRQEQYENAVAQLSVGYFAPFTRDVATGLLFSHSGKECLWWQIPTPASPVALPHANYPHVPTLVLVGDLDGKVPLEETSKVAALFPDSVAITVAEVGHETIFWGTCALSLINEFVETLRIADPSCANTPEVIYPAVGRFPLLARDARAAEVNPGGGNSIGPAERKVVTVTVAAATDALQRSFIGFGDGVGLRGGTFHTDYGDGLDWTSTLTNCAFASDVLVSGTVRWHADNSFDADLVVSGTGTAGGTLHVEGGWQVPGPAGQFKVSGTLGGHKVAVLVPEA